MEELISFRSHRGEVPIAHFTPMNSALQSLHKPPVPSPSPAPSLALACPACCSRVSAGSAGAAVINNWGATCLGAREVGRWRMKSSLVVKRSISLAGRKTGVSIEDAFWNGLKEIAADRNMTVSDLVTTINSKRKHNNLSSAARLFVLDHYRRQAVPLLRKRRRAF
jgi:predicted DNA-binding ribbon-helix-helix protein